VVAPSMPRDPVLRALMAGAVLATVWVFAGPWPDAASWLVQAALDGVFIWFSWKVATRPGIDRSVRRFWRGTTLGGCFFLLGDLYQTVAAARDPALNAAAGTVQTVLVAMGLGSIVWVMLTHPIRVVGRERTRLWLDAATVLCGVAVFAWYFSLSGESTPDTPAQIAVALVGSGLMLVSAFGMCKLLLSGAAPFTFRAGVVGVTSAALVGLETSLHAVVAEASEPGVLIARLLPCFLLAAAPRVQQLQMRVEPSGVTARKRRRYSRLPYIAVGATQALLIVALLDEGLNLRAWGVVVGVVAITALVVVRQTVAFSDNAELLTNLDASMLRLSRQERRFRSLVQHASDVTLVIGGRGRVTYASPALQRVLGLGPEEALGLDPRDLVHPEDRPIADRLRQRLEGSPRTTVTVQLRAGSADGTWRWLQLVATNLVDDPSVEGIIVNARDVSEERQLQERLRYDATHDTLTKLANRAFFDERVRLFASEAPHAETTMAILAVDLDDFKPVNDALGHHVGDALLVAVAERLRRCVLPSDTVARLGGDEFAILLPATSYTGATAIADQILAAFQEPAYVDGHEVPIRASIGIAVGTGADVDTLLRDADAAMYAVKHNGKGRYLYADHRGPSR
jgi:diguanylate cyclase (GGDEF)-like protein/PAS domain S-box-containing protein